MPKYTRLIAAIILLTIFPSLAAQETKSYSRRMNEIKRSGEYVYAESTAADLQEAKASCAELLKIEVSRYLDAKGANSEGRILKNIDNYNCQYLEQSRGDLQRVFGYILKADINTATERESKAKSDIIPGLSEEMENDEPTEATKGAPSMTPGNGATILKTGDLKLAKWQVEMLESIAGEKDMTEGKKMLNRYKNQYRIKRLGGKNSPNPRPADSYYIIYDETETPKALLAPSGNGQHFDMLSGETVDADRYRNYQYYWFQISK